MQAGAGSIDPSLAIGSSWPLPCPEQGCILRFRPPCPFKKLRDENLYDRHQSAYLGRVDLWRIRPQNLSATIDAENRSRCYPYDFAFAVDAIATTCNVVFNTVAVGLSTDLRLSGSIAVPLIGILW